MNVLATAALLLFTLLAVPAASYFFGTPPGHGEWAVLQKLLWIWFAAWITCFTLGEMTGNVSQVDKLWSLLPIVYTWVVAAHGGYTPRLLLMAALVTLWGLRLTWNFSRHGAYRLKFWTGREDYRWQVLRERPEFRARWKWTLFNLIFISGYQNLLILAITLPSVVALQFAGTPLGWLDYLAAALMLCMIGLESAADNQQWLFQSEKHARLRAGQVLDGPCAKGFLDSGLWRYSRHPNYFAEQGIWVSLYGFSVAASGEWLNWSISGCILLLILFRGSTSFSEQISAGKYPEYRDYQQAVPRFIPWGLILRFSTGRRRDY